MTLIHKVLIGVCILLLAIGVFMAALWPAIRDRPIAEHRLQSKRILGNCGVSLLGYQIQKGYVAPSLDEAIRYSLSEKKLSQEEGDKIIALYPQLTYFPHELKLDGSPGVLILHLDSPEKADFDLYSNMMIDQSKN